MSSNTDTIDNLKNSLSNMANNPTAQKYISKLSADREKLTKFIKENTTKVILGVIAAIIVIFYFVVIFRRVPRFISRMKNAFEELSDVQPLQYNRKYMQKDYKLCDFWIASSYKSYLPCTNYYDYAHIDGIKYAIKYGARYIDLDIMNKSFSSCTEPVVCGGEQVGNWHNTTSINFNEVIEFVSKYAFSGNIKNGMDPFFINLNFKTWYNKKTIDKCAEILKAYLSGKFLPQEFSYQGRFSNTNIATTPIKKLIGKVILISTNDVGGTMMDELINLNPVIGGNTRMLTYDKVKESYDPKELAEFNKKNLTFVFPNFKDRQKDNYNFFTPYYLGCQFITMNYSEPNEWMKQYITNFKNCSFILKPFKLRYHPKVIKQPLDQTKKVSFAPRKVSTPFYSITY